MIYNLIGNFTVFISIELGTKQMENHKKLKLKLELKDFKDLLPIQGRLGEKFLISS